MIEVEIADRTLLRETLTEIFMLEHSLKAWTFSLETGLPKEQYPGFEYLEELLGVNLIPFSCLFCLDNLVRSITPDDCNLCLVRDRIPSFNGGLVEHCTSDSSAVYAYQNSSNPDKIKKYADFVVKALDQLLKEKYGRKDSL